MSPLDYEVPDTPAPLPAVPVRGWKPATITAATETTDDDTPAGTVTSVTATFQFSAKPVRGGRSRRWRVPRTFDLANSPHDRALFSHLVHAAGLSGTVQTADLMGKTLEINTVTRGNMTSATVEEFRAAVE